MMLNIKENTIIYIIDYCIETSKKMSNPTITSVSNSADNTNVTVTFSEDVFTESNGTGDLTVSDFSVSVTGGNATLNNIESVSKTNPSEYVLNLSFSGAPDGNEQVEVNVVSDTSIYDSNGNAMLQIISPSSSLVIPKIDFIISVRPDPTNP